MGVSLNWMVVLIVAIVCIADGAHAEWYNGMRTYMMQDEFSGVKSYNMRIEPHPDDIHRHIGLGDAYLWVRCGEEKSYTQFGATIGIKSHFETFMPIKLRFDDKLTENHDFLWNTPGNLAFTRKDVFEKVKAMQKSNLLWIGFTDGDRVGFNLSYKKYKKIIQKFIDTCATLDPTFKEEK